MPRAAPLNPPKQSCPIRRTGCNGSTYSRFQSVRQQHLTWRQTVSKRQNVYSKLPNSSEVGLSYPHKTDLVWIWSFYHFLWFWHWHSLQESGTPCFLSAFQDMAGGLRSSNQKLQVRRCGELESIYARCIRLKAKEARTPNSRFWPLVGLCRWSETLYLYLCKWQWIPWSGRARLCAKGAIADPSSVATWWQASQKEHPWAALTFKLFKAVQGRPWTQSTASQLGVEYLQRLRRVLVGNTCPG